MLLFAVRLGLLSSILPNCQGRAALSYLHTLTCSLREEVFQAPLSWCLQSNDCLAQFLIDQRSGWVLVSKISLLGKEREVGQLYKECSYFQDFSPTHTYSFPLCQIYFSVLSPRKGTQTVQLQKSWARLIYILWLSPAMAVMVRIPEADVNG